MINDKSAGTWLCAWRWGGSLWQDTMGVSLFLQLSQSPESEYFIEWTSNTQTELFGSRFNSTRLWCRIVPAQFKSFDFCHYFGPAWKQHMRLPNTLFKTDCEVTLKTSDIYFPLVLIHQWYTLIFDDLQYNPLNLRGACCSLAATSEQSHETDVFEGCYSFWFTGICVSKCSKSHLPSSWRDLDFFLKESKTHF